MYLISGPGHFSIEVVQSDEISLRSALNIRPNVLNDVVGQSRPEVAKSDPCKCALYPHVACDREIVIGQQYLFPKNSWGNAQS